MTQDEYSEKVDKLVNIINESPQIKEFLETVGPGMAFIMAYSAHIRSIEALFSIASEQLPGLLPSMRFILSHLRDQVDIMEIDKDILEEGKTALDKALADHVCVGDPPF